MADRSEAPAPRRVGVRVEFRARPGRLEPAVGGGVVAHLGGPPGDAATLGWAVEAAQAWDRTARVPFTVAGQPAGAVARADLAALADAIATLGPAAAAAWRVAPDGVELRATAAGRDEALAGLNAELRRRGLVRGWRDEPFPLPALDTLATLAVLERAAARFWGSLTFAAHATGWVAGVDGRPAALWIATRAAGKATDPGLLDTLVGGGVAHGQSPWEALQREAWEEAGLPPALAATARPCGALATCRDVPQGLQREWLFVHDLQLPPDHVPWNPDGEVAGFERLPVPEALARAATPAMTADAALVTLDFAVRHRLLPADEATANNARLAALRIPRPGYTPLRSRGPRP